MFAHRVLAIHVETHLRAEVDAEVLGRIILEHHRHVDVVGMIVFITPDETTHFTSVIGLFLSALSSKHDFRANAEVGMELVLHQQACLIIKHHMVSAFLPPKVGQVKTHLGTESHLSAGTHASQHRQQHCHQFLGRVHLFFGL